MITIEEGRTTTKKIYVKRDGANIGSYDVTITEYHDGTRKVTAIKFHKEFEGLDVEIGYKYLVGIFNILLHLGVDKDLKLP